MAEGNNLYYMRARYYDANLGRFISEDPAGFVDGTNLYAYVGGNPVMAVDPSGLGAERAGISNAQIARFQQDAFDIALNVAGVGAVGKVAKGVAGIYEFIATTGKTYVGQSSNIFQRLGQHIASGKLDPTSTVQTTEVLGGKVTREVAEQLRINELGGIQNLENVRNPIGPSRQHLLPPN